MILMARFPFLYPLQQLYPQYLNQLHFQLCIESLTYLRLGSISLGIALVAGQKHVPKPATGIAAFFILFILSLPFSLTKLNMY